MGDPVMTVGKKFNLDHAMKSRICKDACGVIWRLVSVDVSEQQMYWETEREKLKSSFTGEIISLKRAGFLSSAEIKKTVSVAYAAKNVNDDKFVFYEKEAMVRNATNAYQFVLHLHDDELVKVDFKRLDKETVG
jgi:hypothetical protein